MHCAYIKLEYIIQNLSMYNYNLSGEALEYSGTLCLVQLTNIIISFEFTYYCCRIRKDSMKEDLLCLCMCMCM